MTYRSELEALKERHALLERNLAEIRAVAATLEATRGQEAEVLAALAKSAATIEGMNGNVRRELPMLDDVRVASECSADWNKMKGDERVRHCCDCKKDVYNLSGLTREAAETLIRETEGALCITFFRRDDGTILTSDCSEGASIARRKRRFHDVAILAVGALMLATMAYRATSQPACSKEDSPATSKVPAQRSMGARAAL